MAHLYKSRLQNYAQKRNIPFPTYTTETQGPPHARLFKSQVTIDGNTYAGSEFSSTLKDAEHMAAKVACMSLSAEGPQEDDCLYKSLLQELAQKKGQALPIYATNKTGPLHVPCFISTVQISGGSYVGQEARTKKQAEINAAKVAYTVLTEGGPRANNGTTISNNAGASSSGSSTLQTVVPHKNEPTVKKLETIINNGVGYSIPKDPANARGGPVANNVTATSNIVGISSSDSSTLHTVMIHKNEPTTGKMQIADNNRVSFSIPDDPEKAKGYLELKGLQDAMDKRTLALPHVMIHQAQPESPPNLHFAKTSIQPKNHENQAGPGSSGKKIQPFVKEPTLSPMIDAGSARRQATKLLIRPHVQGMTYDGPIQVSDDEWVAMKVPSDDGP